MTYNVILKRRRDNGYVATVPALPGVRVAGATRHAAVAAAVDAIERRLAEVEVVPVEVNVHARARAYSPDELALARAAAQRRGEPDAPITGDPLIDFAGCLAHLPDEDWDEYEAAIREMREEEDRKEFLP